MTKQKVDLKRHIPIAIKGKISETRKENENLQQNDVIYQKKLNSKDKKKLQYQFLLTQG